jgi:hypothetical protein
MLRPAWVWLALGVLVACDDGDDRRHDDTGAAGRGAGASGGSGPSSGSGASGAGTSGLGPVQCRTHADCDSAGPDATCSLTTPGGVCVDCDPVNGSCPPGTTCVADTMGLTKCIRSCDGDADCNLGMRCDTGECVPRSCAAPDYCPEPYVCIASRCLRPSCAQDPSCPDPLVCNSLDYCVEP